MESLAIRSLNLDYIRTDCPTVINIYQTGPATITFDKQLSEMECDTNGFVGMEEVSFWLPRRIYLDHRNFVNSTLDLGILYTIEGLRRLSVYARSQNGKHTSEIGSLLQQMQTHLFQ